LSFGTGIGAAVAFPLVAFILLPASRVRRRTVLAFSLVALSLPILYLAAYRAARFYAAPDSGDLDVALVGLQVWRPLALATVQLAAYGLSSLIAGPFRYPLAFPNPAVYGVAALALGAAASAFALTGERDRRELLAALVLALACYGIIAVGRVSVFMMIAAARYHYAAALPLCSALIVTLAVFGERRPLPPTWRGPILALALAAVVAPNLTAARPIDDHRAARAAAAQAVATIREQVNAAAPGADVYIQNQPFRGV